MENLRIDKPCPMLLMRMDKNGDKFTCKSCNEDVIDFRGKSHSEILEAKENGSNCGIYYADQLQSSPKMSFFRRFIFHSLSVLSFLGFNVSPINAATQEKPMNFDQLEITKTEDHRDKDKDKKKKKKKSKKKQVTMGKTISWPNS